MKKFMVIIMALIFVCGLLAGCGGSKEKATGGSTVSLAKIKQAAKDTGYAVTDDYVAFSMEDVKGGFTVEIAEEKGDVIYSILECGSEDAAIKNAKTINDAGYNIALRNGKILTFYGVDEKDGVIKGILESIIKGNPVAPKN